MDGDVLPPGAAQFLSSKGFKIFLPIFRTAILLLSLTALALLVEDKESSNIDASVFSPQIPTGSPMVAKTASYKLIPSLKYYVAVMAAAAIYYCVQLVLDILSLFGRNLTAKGRWRNWPTFMTDQVMAYLMVSAGAVAVEIGYLADKGAEDVMWKPVCVYFNHFCVEYAIGLAHWWLATFLGLLMAAISSYQLFHFSPPPNPKSLFHLPTCEL